MSKLVFSSFFVLFVLIGSEFLAQTNSLEISAEKEKKFTPYMHWRHGGIEGLAEFKKNHPYDYLKELWYFSSSFYVSRNHLASGVSLDESIIDISRFESARRENEESIVELPGFRDVLVLLPANRLIYKPKNN